MPLAKASLERLIEASPDIVVATDARGNVAYYNDGAERVKPDEVALPHSWGDDGPGVALFETRFRTDGIDPLKTQIGAVFDPGRGKANLYLNGHLLGRYWPERGPQRRFPLPWGVLRPDDENQLAIAVWKRTPEAVLGRVRLEAM